MSNKFFIIAIIFCSIFTNYHYCFTLNETIYDTVNELENDLVLVGKIFANEYWNLTKNDDTLLSNWKAYSQILKQVNNALFDIIVQTIMETDLMEKIDDKCKQSLIEFFLGLVQQESWAYKSKIIAFIENNYLVFVHYLLFFPVLDSNGFISPGILEGSFTNFGDFNECIYAGNDKNENHSLSQYCLIKYHLDIPTNLTRMIAQDLVFNTTGTSLENTVNCC